MLKANWYFNTRNHEDEIAADKLHDIPEFNFMNPRLLSNNLLVPYIIAVWEEYFRATFTAVLRYADKREMVLKKARLSHKQLEKIAVEKQIERAIAECFSFQRPSAISENFKMVDAKLNLASTMRKPYNRRKTTLYDSIENIVENRNAFVHAGQVDMALFDKEMKAIFSDLEAAITLSHSAIGAHFNFEPIQYVEVDLRHG